MDGLGIQKIIESAQAQHHKETVEGVLFSTRKMEPVIHDPHPEALEVHSLTAIVDYINSKLDSLKDEEGGDVIIHVETPTLISLVSTARPPLMARTIWLQAFAPENPFKYGQKYDPEYFNIALQSLFVDAADRASVLLLAGTIKSEAAEMSKDDGVTQTVEARRNVAFAQEAKIPNPVTLKPWRTFREVDQPSSIFVFRAHEGPTLALYEADGSAWKLEAMQSIKAWLAEKLPDIAVIA